MAGWGNSWGQSWGVAVSNTPLLPLLFSFISSAAMLSARSVRGTRQLAPTLAARSSLLSVSQPATNKPQIKITAITTRA